MRFNLTLSVMPQSSKTPTAQRCAARSTGHDGHCIVKLVCRVVSGAFEPTAENSDSGWVTADGMGAFQVGHTKRRLRSNSAHHVLTRMLTALIAGQPQIAVLPECAWPFGTAWGLTRR